MATETIQVPFRELPAATESLSSGQVLAGDAAGVKASISVDPVAQEMYVQLGKQHYAVRLTDVVAAIIVATAPDISDKLVEKSDG